MTKISEYTKRYIKDYTKRCSNELCCANGNKCEEPTLYHEWLTVDDAESVCEIERENVLLEVKIWIRDNLSQFDITDTNGYTIDINNIVHDFDRCFK